MYVCVLNNTQQEGSRRDDDNHNNHDDDDDDNTHTEWSGVLDSVYKIFSSSQTQQ